MITSLNPGVSFFMILVSLLILENEGTASAGAFCAGLAVTLPLIAMVWRTMKRNWPMYRRFYSMPLHKRDYSAIRKSWRLTWWVIPYAIIAYSLLDVWLLLNPQYGSPIALLAGALFAVFGYTLLQSPKYYEDLRKGK